MADQGGLAEARRAADEHRVGRTAAGLEQIRPQGADLGLAPEQALGRERRGNQLVAVEAGQHLAGGRTGLGLTREEVDAQAIEVGRDAGLALGRG